MFLAMFLHVFRKGNRMFLSIFRNVLLNVLFNVFEFSGKGIKCFWVMFLSIFRNVCWSMFSGRRNIFLMFSGKFKVFKKHIKTNSQNVYGTVTHFWVNIFFLTSKAKNYRNI
uniref:Candidate secreted effector n=1 Tax=Meloidogyne incognita TaxID=6306 RepID=A0A914M750_MELIC